MLSGSVLFVDDQVDITDLIRRMLQNEDYTQYYANSGAEALEIMEKHPVNVVVTDMVMPLVSGLQLLNIIKEKYPDTVRIVLSGQLQIASVLAAINSGEVYRYITKPWKVDAESKMIIRQALEYSDYLRKKNDFSEDTDYIRISAEAFKKVLGYIDNPFFLTFNDTVTDVVSQGSQLVTKGDCIESLKENIDLKQYLKIELSPVYQLYVKQ